MPHKQSNYNTLQTDPSLSDDQRQQLAAEIERLEKVFQTLLLEQPLDFSTAVALKSGESARANQVKRDFIFLMRELTDVRTVQTAADEH